MSLSVGGNKDILIIVFSALCQPSRQPCPPYDQVSHGTKGKGKGLVQTMSLSVGGNNDILIIVFSVDFEFVRRR
jgi:hypothetical protein